MVQACHVVLLPTQLPWAGPLLLTPFSPSLSSLDTYTVSHSTLILNIQFTHLSSSDHAMLATFFDSATAGCDGGKGLFSESQQG